MRPTTFALRLAGYLIVLGGIAGVGLGLVVIAAASHNIPEVSAVVDYRPKLPLRVYSADGVLIGEYGEERRNVVRIDEVPEHVKQAILAAEDDGFYRHSGIDLVSIGRSIFTNVATGRRAQGGSTITMQVARNFFLSREKTFTRKIYEVLLAFEIERKLTKDQILELYINQIYLGRRAYGFAAAARVYFNKPLAQVSIAEAAMLAGLPKAPSAYNPITNPRRAAIRQGYVLGRMEKLGMITEAQYKAAVDEPVGRRAAQAPGPKPTDSALFAAELVRQEMFARFGAEVYTRGISVVTTIISKDQTEAQLQLQKGILAYERRQPWRGPEQTVSLAAGLIDEQLEEQTASLFEDIPTVGGLEPVVVLSASAEAVEVLRPSADRLTLKGAQISAIQAGLGKRASSKQAVRRGSVLRLSTVDGKTAVVQLPEVEGALVAIQAETGAITAMAGGFDFFKNNFNHVTQAYRQPGSVIKPFIYTSALERGYSASTIIDDTPVRFDPIRTGGELWEPKNYDGKYEGPIAMGKALALSKNMVSIRIVDAVGPDYVQSFIARFGFEPARNPPYLTIALGAGSATPLEVGAGFAVFANGGYRVTPYLIDRVLDETGRVIEKASPQRAGEDAPQVLAPATAFMAHDLMRRVVENGTGRRALSLGRSDLAGKTGTTNDSQDAWFGGYSSGIAAAVWVGYDKPRSLGDKETGSAVALPIWTDFMATALQGRTPRTWAAPEGVFVAEGTPYTDVNSPANGVRRLGESSAESFFRGLLGN